MNPHTLATLLTDLLSACEDAYQDAGLDPPSRRFVTHGQPVWQGEQLTVTLVSFGPVAPFPVTALRAPKSVVVPGADLAVEIVRSCWPQPSSTAPGSALPSPSAISDAALGLAVDAAVIGAWLQTLSVEGGMFQHLPLIDTSQDVAVKSMLPLGPQGPLAGWRLPISVKLVAVP